MIKRELEAKLEARSGTDKALIIFGPRQVGKTTLLESLFASNLDVLWMNGDNPQVQDLFINMTADKFSGIIGKNKFFILDEAQRIEDIGLKLKIIHDSHKKDVQIIATGSSSFDLANKVNESMTGRKWQYNLFPLSFKEMTEHHGLFKETQNLENRLLYGYYPAVVSAGKDAKEVLSNIANDYLYKDAYMWEEIRKPRKFEDLLKALAYQIGSEGNYSELSNLTGLTRATVDKYIRLLEHNFIIYRLGSFSKNLRNELKASEKIYFYDTGIRNAVIGDFTPIANRQDIGHLFENFIISEFAKKLIPASVGSFGYFWRTKQKQEIDFVNTIDGRIVAYEIKWNEKTRVKFPASFIEKYQPEAHFINRTNFSDFLL